ncbi:MAG: serine hydrolase domain-containing protein [Verrucomicrobiota bacterium]
MEEIQPVIQNFLEELVLQNKERGIQFVAYHQGKVLVDAYAGICNPQTGKKVESSTLFPVFSTTKGMAATLIHLLVERGQLNYQTRIADLWSEFGAHGKTEITVAHALNHSAGLPYMPLGLRHRDLSDWTKMCELIADLTPASAPGALMCYHAITYGWILGEVARRVDGRFFTQMLADEISRPLGVTTMYVGLPDSFVGEVALLESGFEEKTEKIILTESKPQAIPDLVCPLHEWMNRDDAQRACLPASNGVMNAHSIARHYAALLPGGVGGVELLPPSRVRLALELQHPTQSQDPEYEYRQRLGYQMISFASPSGFGHHGYGGSSGFADPELGLAVGFTRNRFSKENPLSEIMGLLLKSLK